MHQIVGVPPSAGAVRDNLDELVARQGEIRSRDLHVLRPERFTDRPKGGTTMNTPDSKRPTAAPAYYLGRGFSTWQKALYRRNSAPRQHTRPTR